ncbi:MAG: hypothetical protein RMJ43_11600, partial [Chloroherpetonaceae bacterium]|nr:hypothetical protein [Chloroherpetonaceae bacterium]
MASITGNESPALTGRFILRAKGAFAMCHRLYGAASVLALSVLGLQTVSPAFAAPPLPAPEPSFMGIRLLASFREVLKRFGQPQEIQIGEPYIPGTGAPQVTTPGSGGLAMGGPAMGGSPYGVVSGGGPRMGMGMGMPASGGLPTFPTGRMGGGLRQDDDESE